jgi:hypothetical protein
MTNPYQPPQESSESRLPELLVPGTYAGGFWAVTAVGILGGMLVAFAIYSEALLPASPFIVPAIVWVAAFLALLLMLRGSQVQMPTLVLLPLLLTVPAYILYVPVCTFSSMFTMSFMGSDGYVPTFPGLIFGSVISFVAILLLFASVLRRRFKQPLHSEDAVIQLSGETDVTKPLSESPNE